MRRYTTNTGKGRGLLFLHTAVFCILASFTAACVWADAMDTIKGIQWVVMSDSGYGYSAADYETLANIGVDAVLAKVNWKDVENNGFGYVLDDYNNCYNAGLVWIPQIGVDNKPDRLCSNEYYYRYKDGSYHTANDVPPNYFHPNTQYEVCTFIKNFASAFFAKYPGRQLPLIYVSIGHLGESYYPNGSNFAAFDSYTISAWRSYTGDSNAMPYSSPAANDGSGGTLADFLEFWYAKMYEYIGYTTQEVANDFPGSKVGLKISHNPGLGQIIERQVEAALPYGNLAVISFGGPASQEAGTAKVGETAWRYNLIAWVESFLRDYNGRSNSIEYTRPRLAVNNISAMMYATILDLFANSSEFNDFSSLISGYDGYFQGFDKNIALWTDVTASSEYSYLYSPDNSKDGVYGAWDSNEWASRGETAPWIKYTWNTGQNINNVVFYDRCNPVDQILDAWMYLRKNGQTVKSVHLGMFPYGGAAKKVVFDTVNADELYLDVIGGKGLNVGLSEVKICYDSNANSGDLAVPGNGCTVTSSSEYGSGYRSELAIDGVYGGWDSNEWASNGEMSPWIKFRWDTDQTVNKVVLYDRCNPVDQILDAWMYLKKGGQTVKSIHLGMFPYGGAGKEVIFDPITIDEIYLDITEGTGFNVGLSEIQVFYDPSLNSYNLASAGNGCTVTASSEYSYGYRKEMVIDGFYGAWDSSEWASDGEGEGAWIQLNWAAPQVMNTIVLYDRCNRYDQIKDADLLINRSDGSQTVKHIGQFPYGGGAKEIYLTEAEGENVISVKVYITDVASSTANAGLSEILCYRDPYKW